MKYVDEFRDPQQAQLMVDRIRAAARRRWTIMDVCGGQTHSLLRYGIEEALREHIELMHGPGCPVCVTHEHSIDLAQQLAARDDTLVASFGDMLRVPGSRDSLLEVRARGGHVVVVYSPLDAVALALRHPDRQIVFFAVGFETTAPASALAVLQARQLGLSNFSLLVSHVRVLPAMAALMDSPDVRVDAFLAAGHVCTVTGFGEYDAFVERYRVPVVVTGFEPLDLLSGIAEAVEQLEQGQARVANSYARSVRRQGNPQACQAIGQVYEIADCAWRGFGSIAQGGLRLRPEFRSFDARSRFGDCLPLPVISSQDCRSAEVMSGRIKPPACPHFATTCHPDHPRGAPMVSDEGACAAYFRYST